MTVGANQELLDSPSSRFHGCLENLQYNGVDLVALARRHDPRVSIQVSAASPLTKPGNPFTELLHHHHHLQQRLKV